MSMWKPGDVAMVECRDGKERPATYQHSTRGPYWRFRDGLLRDAGISEARPLVVIDPNDRETAARLYRSWCDNLGGPGLKQQVDAMQTALRGLIASPKPEEPGGLGAVVEDADGVRWVKVSDAAGMWQDRHIRDVWCTYDDIDAVLVLSEGVTP